MYVFKRIQTIQKPTTNEKNKKHKKINKTNKKNLNRKNKILYFTRKTIL